MGRLDPCPNTGFLPIFQNNIKAESEFVKSGKCLNNGGLGHLPDRLKWHKPWDAAIRSQRSRAPFSLAAASDVPGRSRIYKNKPATQWLMRIRGN